MTMIQERLYQEEKQVALQELHLDPNNVRFRHISFKNERDMEDYLYQEEDVKFLIKQIISDKRVQQPIYVIEDSDGQYIVKEGNRRTVALRKIDYDIKAGKIKGFEKNHFEVIPVYVLHGSKHEIDVFVAQDHVSGKNAWAALNKASVIYDFRDNYGESFEEIAVELGMTKGKVQQHYNAFKATENFGKRFPDEKNYLTKFSYFQELYQSSILKKWLSMDPSNLDYYTELVKKQKLDASYKGPRLFAKIIGSQNPIRANALAKLDADEGDIHKAFTIVAENQARSSGVWSTIKSIKNGFDEIKHDEFNLAIEDPEKFDMLVDLILKLQDIHKQIVLLSESRRMV